MLTKTYFRRKLAQACGLGLVLCAAAACAPQQNVLTKEEIADGWQLLFDGKTLDQWNDYNGEELMAMFRMRCKKNGYRLTEEAETYAKEFFEDMYKNRDDNFGNGRDVRNRFEDIISRQANRLAAMEAPTKDDLMTITKEDFLVPAEE